MSQTENTGRDELSDEEMRFAREDHLVRCNSCGFTRRKSDPGGCPKRHVSGWSYAGWIEGEVVPVAEAVTDVEGVDVEMEEGLPGPEGVGP